MKKIIAYLKAKVPYLMLSVVLMAPVFTTLTACGDEINGPRVEDDEPDGENRQGGTEGD